MFKLLRFYSVASFISIAVAALLLALFYRQVTVSGVVELAEKSNVTLARTALSSVRHGLVAYLALVADAGGETPAAELHPPHRLMGEISALMRDAAITRIKVYNRKGTVVFSTKMSQIGKDQSRNPAFAAALNGRITSKLVYRDTFNTFDAVTEEDNLIQTYLPVQAGPAEPIEGVFEIYTDVNHLVVDNERSLFVIMLGAGGILLALYGILVLLVRYARGIIDEQQQTIRERTAILEVLSAQMLKSEEMEKKKMAFELHEGLAQTLAAIKVLVENARQRLDADDAKSLEAIVPALQDTIREVRTMATELRPSSLDDLGLLPALKEFSGRFEELHPDIRLEQDVAMEERAIPPPLKVVLYRIVESAVKALAQPGNIDRIRLSLRQAGQKVTLEINDLPTAAAGTAPGADDGELQMRFADMQERAILSGGVFSMERNGRGGVTLRAAWAARPG